MDDSPEARQKPSSAMKLGIVTPAVRRRKYPSRAMGRVFTVALAVGVTLSPFKYITFKPSLQQDSGRIRRIMRPNNDPATMGGVRFDDLASGWFVRLGSPNQAKSYRVWLIFSLLGWNMAISIGNITAISGFELMAMILMGKIKRPKVQLKCKLQNKRSGPRLDL